MILSELSTLKNLHQSVCIYFSKELLYYTYSVRYVKKKRKMEQVGFLRQMIDAVKSKTVKTGNMRYN